MKQFVIAGLIFVFLAVPAVAGSDGKGGQPGSFRDMSLGSRAAALGGAFTAMADGGCGELYNPAGAAQSRQYAASFAYRIMHLDRRLGYAVLSIPAKEEAALAMSWIHAGTAKLQARDEQGYVIEGEDISHQENLIGVSFSKKIVGPLILGGRVFYVQNTIGPINAYTAGVDFGALGIIDIRKSFLGKCFPQLRTGLAVKNIGASYKWITTDLWTQLGREQGAEVEEKFPQIFRLGLALNRPDAYLVTTDLEINTVSAFRLRLGGEYNYRRMLALRAGLDDSHPTLGLGVNKNLEKFSVAIDLAYLFDRVGEGDDVMVSFDLLF